MQRRKINMTLRQLFSRHAGYLSKSNGRMWSSQSSGYRCVATATMNTRPLFYTSGDFSASSNSGPNNPKFYLPQGRYMHSLQGVSLEDSSSDLECESEEDATMNEFLSRFVWIMTKKLNEAYPGCDKNTIDGMLVIIVGKVVSELQKGGLEQMMGASASASSQDFSPDLWRTVWDVSNVVLQDMEKEKKKEKMKSFLQSEEVKEMYRFAGEVGIRGEMLRELRFKWAREKMEESEFYESLERFRKEEAQRETKEKEQSVNSTVSRVEGMGDTDNADEGSKQKTVSLPQRHGRIKYKIYGLDLSDAKWAEVADKIQESGEILWPQEPKPLSGRSKLVTDKILSLQERDDPAPILGEWIELVQPKRVDWISLLDRLKDHNSHTYFKVAEFALGEKSFQPNIRDYSQVIDSLAKKNCLEDAERILKKMNENGIVPDVIMSSILVHMYCKSGNLDQAKEAFDGLRAHGFQPDTKVYNSLIMAYVNAGQPRLGESLVREMENRDIKQTKEIYMALLQSFAQRGDFEGANRTSTAMEILGVQPSLESCTLMVEACARAGNLDRAQQNFDQMRKLGFKPDDRCMAHMIGAYEKKNFLDDALSLLIELEKDGLEPGVATYTVMVDWLSKLGLYDEAEQILGKIAELGEAPPVKLHVSLCDMYIKAGSEKKALQSLGVLESKFEQLEPVEFERIINSLIDGGFMQDAQRIQGLMEGQGFELSNALKVKLMASQTMGKSNKSTKAKASQSSNK
ncbi:pentatricopeptide repeat-containing protein At3g09060 [Andrographis paniculata]|uniref:pentatricopeptide repeat-containing protein At3g09060 n=1 Tax=Andrographis paniculata TaxID=175694 RepID=UPI0021E89344|nr:pentatricopeptide repeat-containing protein At3g09060 [Andrographis paniculata]